MKCWLQFHVQSQSYLFSLKHAFFFKNQDLYKDFPEYVNHLYFNRVGVTTAQDYDYKTVTRRSMVEQQTQNNTFVLPIVLGWPKPEGGDPSSFLMLASLNDFPMERMVNIGTFIEIQTLKKKKKKKRKPACKSQICPRKQCFLNFSSLFFLWILWPNIKVKSESWKSNKNACSYMYFNTKNKIFKNFLQLRNHLVCKTTHCRETKNMKAIREKHGQRHTFIIQITQTHTQTYIHTEETNIKD